MLSYDKSGTTRPGDQLNGFENGKTQLFNSKGVGKWTYFQKKSGVFLLKWLILVISVLVVIYLDKIK